MTSTTSTKTPPTDARHLALYEELDDVLAALLHETNQNNNNNNQLTKMRDTAKKEYHPNLKAIHALGAILFKCYNENKRNPSFNSICVTLLDLNLPFEDSKRIRHALFEKMVPVMKGFYKPVTINQLPACNFIEDYGFLLTDATDELRLKKHHVPVRRFLENFEAANSLNSIWDQHRRNCGFVLRIGGSSGSGKTMFALLAAKFRRQNNRFDNNVVIYSTPHGLLNLAKNWNETEQSYFHRVDRARLVREIVYSIVDRLFQSNDIRADDASGYHVVFVFDDMGNYPIFAHQVESSAQELAKELHNVFFTDPFTWYSPLRVHFIVAGSGLAVEAGYDDLYYLPESAVMLDDPELQTERLLRDLLEWQVSGEESVQRHLRCIFYHSWWPEKFGDERSILKEMTKMERILRELVKNTRCAAVFLRSVNKALGRKDVSCVDRLGSQWQNQLAGFGAVTVANYIERTEMKKFAEPRNILLASLAAAVYRLPFLPKSIEGGDALFKLRANNDDEYTSDRHHCITMYSILCSDGRVLDDVSFGAYMSVEGRDFYLKAFAVEDESTRRTPNDISTDRYAPFSGRYFFPHAHAAMLHFLYGTSRRDNNWSGLEQRVADFCLFVASASPFYSKMKNAIRKEGVININKFEATINSKHDPLWPLKQELVWNGVDDPARMDVRLVENEEQFAFEGERKQTDDEWRKSKGEIIKQTFKLIQDSKTGCFPVLVMVSAPSEPYFDVGVAARNRLIQIQVKSRVASISPIDPLAEFSKLNYLTTSTGDATSAQQRYFEFLVEQCCVDSSKPVEVVSIILVEADNTTNKGYWSQVKHFVDRCIAGEEWSLPQPESDPHNNNNKSQNDENTKHRATTVQQLQSFAEACNTTSTQNEEIRTTSSGLIRFTHKARFIVIPGHDRTTTTHHQYCWKHRNPLFPALIPLV